MTYITVFDEKNLQYTLIPINKSGGEGTIYRIQGHPNECAKIYHDTNITKELKNKIQAMVNNPPDDPTKPQHNSIAWPITLLYRDKQKKQFIGFIMPMVDETFKESHFYWDSEDRIKNFSGTFTYEYLITAARNIASVIAAIHEKGHRIGDLRDRNILIGPSALVTIIDCDSFQIRDKKEGKIYYSRVGTPEFLPPEFFNIDFGKQNTDRYFSDLFGLGVIIFQLLMIGFHPYSSKGKLVQDAPTTLEKIKKGFFVYSGQYKHISPPSWAPPYEMIFPKIQDLFKKCFSEGHKNPSIRPKAIEWFEVLKDSQKSLTTCKKNSNHKYFDCFNQCPWCKYQKEHFNFDPFPQKLIIIPKIKPSPKLTLTVPPVPRPPPSPIPTTPLINYSRIVKIIGAVIIILIIYMAFFGPKGVSNDIQSNPTTNGITATYSPTSPIPEANTKVQTTQSVTNLDVNEADFWIQKGENYFNNADYTSTISSFNKAISINPSKKFYTNQYVKKMIDRADYLKSSINDFSGAIAIYNSVLLYTNLDENSEQNVMQNKLFCLTKLGRDDEASRLNLEIQRKFYPEQYNKFVR